MRAAGELARARMLALEPLELSLEQAPGPFVDRAYSETTVANDHSCPCGSSHV